MAVFVNDTFTDTNGTAITSHTGETGATWTKHNSAGNTAVPTVQSNAIEAAETNTRALYYASGSPAGADYEATATFVVTTTSNNNVGAAAVRMQTGAATCYVFGYVSNFGSPILQLEKQVSGSGTYLGSNVGATLGTGTYYLTCKVIGTALTGRVQRASDSFWLTSAGTWQASQTDCCSATDSAISTAGKAGFGIGCRSATNENSIAAFSAQDVSSAPTLSSPTGTQTGTTTATVGATTDTGSGTLYAVVTTSSTQPSAAQVKAGNDAAGSAAAWSGSVAVSSSGAKTLNAIALSASTTYYAHLVHNATSDSNVVTSASFTTSAAGDTTPPTLTSPTGTSTGTTTATGTVSTNEANGTLYYYASTNSTETAATVKASGSTQAISSTGVKTVSFTGLSSGTAYYAHYVHRDAAGNDSARVSSAVFTTSSSGDTTPPTLSSPTGTSTGTTTASGTVSTNEATGTLYRLASINSTELAATVKAANLTQTVTATGVQSVTFSGLSAGTTYYAHYVHRDAAGNDSSRVSSSSFTTDTAEGNGTLSLLNFGQWTGTAHYSITVPFVKVCGPLPAGTTVLELTDQTIDSGGDMQISDATLLVGYYYMVFGFNTDGSLSFKKKVLAS